MGRQAPLNALDMHWCHPWCRCQVTCREGQSDRTRLPQISSATHNQFVSGQVCTSSACLWCRRLGSGGKKKHTHLRLRWEVRVLLSPPWDLKALLGPASPPFLALLAPMPLYPICALRSHQIDRHVYNVETLTSHHRSSLLQPSEISADIRCCPPGMPAVQSITQPWLRLTVCT